MTVTYHEEIAEGRRAQNRLGIRTYSRSFRLSTDAQADDAYAVGSHASLPVIGSTHPSDAAAYCQVLTVENSDPWRGWTVTAEYSTERTIHTTDPTSDEVLVSWTSEIYQIPIFEDTSGNGLLNSAGDYFIDPAPTRDEADFIATINCNVSSIPAWTVSLQNTVNSAGITIDGLAIGAELAKVGRITIGQRQKRNASTFYPVTAEIHIRAAGWLFEPLDAGFRELNAAGDGLIQIKNEDGEEVTSPAPLNGSGAAIAKPTPATVVYGSFDVYPTGDLTTIPGIT